METNFFNRFLSNQNRISREHPDFRRTYLINTILSVMILFFLLFAILDLLVFDLIEASITNCAAFLVSVITLIYFQKTDRVRIAAIATVSILAIIILLVIYLIAPNNYIFFWMVALPPVAFFLLGKKFGYLVSIIFGAIAAVFYLAGYQNWDLEFFGLAGALNVSIAYVGLVLSMAFFETSRQEAFEEMLKDIERRKLAEQTLKVNEARLYELNATKDKFFSIIAHDLRSPFNSIMGFSELVHEQVQSKDYERVEEFTTYIMHSSQQVMDLLKNLLEWSRLQTDRIHLNREYFEIGTLVNQIFNLFNDAAKQKMIVFSAELPRNATLFADKGMIESVLRNLISNAIKFTHSGGRITLSCKQYQDEHIMVVSDTGVGMRAEEIDKLFRMDENYSTYGTQDEKGSGLGLLLCKEFVEKHGGKIQVESEVGTGSSFTFSIPVLKN